MLLMLLDKCFEVNFRTSFEPATLGIPALTAYGITIKLLWLRQNRLIFIAWPTGSAGMTMVRLVDFD